MLQFSTTSKECSTNGVKMLVYGRSGTGKTMLCATAPNPIILSAEAGLLSLSPQNIKKVFGQAMDITVLKITTVQDLQEAYGWLTSNDQHAQAFETICLDSITEIAEQVLSNAKSQVKDPRQAYGELIEKCTMLLKMFRDIPGKHVYVSAKEETAADSATGIQLFGPSMPGSKMSQQLPYLFDEVFNLNIGKTEKEEYRYLRTAPDLQYDAKDRSGCLEVIEHPNLTNIINKIIT